MASMNIRNRIQKLEQMITLLASPDTCPSCGGPAPGINRCVLCHSDNTPLDPQCPKCGLLVDGEGKSMPTAHALAPSEPAYQKRILLEEVGELQSSG